MSTQQPHLSARPIAPRCQRRAADWGAHDPKDVLMYVPTEHRKLVANQQTAHAAAAAANAKHNLPASRDVTPNNRPGSYPDALARTQRTAACTRHPHQERPSSRTARPPRLAARLPARAPSPPCSPPDSDHSTAATTIAPTARTTRVVQPRPVRASPPVCFGLRKPVIVPAKVDVSTDANEERPSPTCVIAGAISDVAQLAAPMRRVLARAHA